MDNFDYDVVIVVAVQRVVPVPSLPVPTEDGALDKKSDCWSLSHYPQNC